MEIRKCILVLVLGIILPLSASGQLIPTPREVSPAADGALVWDSPAKVTYQVKEPGHALLKEYFSSLGDGGIFASSAVEAQRAKVEIKLIQKNLGYTSDKEAYELQVTPKGAQVKANTQAGLFYGFQTLMQLRDSYPQGIPCLTIKDQPQFPYRGFMLDVSRHFFPKEFIFKQIDLLSSVKVNVLHLHLVDTGGWRVEIKKYPSLTERTAWRTESDWRKWTASGAEFCLRSEDAYGGFYTQDDIREIIHYAAVHQMEVIPEIDMPGHSSEVLAIMPELLCQGNPRKGTAEMCLGNEQTYQFCKDVLDEIMELFPSKYIHIGGDECGTAAWAQCPLCQEKMKKEEISSVSHLQESFTRRIEEYVTSRGKTIIGWDEMLSESLSPGATIMSWHEDSEGRNRIVESGHPMIISSEGHFYLDYYQDYPDFEPLCFGGYTPLRKTYSFNPFEDLPEGGRGLVLGLQCNLWTEAVQTLEHAERMMYPRVLAMAETAWSMPAEKDYDGFKARIQAFQARMEGRGYHPFDISNEFGPRPGSNVAVKSLALGCPAKFGRRWSANFEATGETSLTDGLLGDWGMNGLRWMGFDAFMDVTVDLGSLVDIHSVHTSFMQNAFTSMYIPEAYEIRISADGESFTPLYSLDYPVDRSRNYCIVDLGWSGETKARYVQVIARHPSRWCWLMCDEIIVR